MKRIPLLLLIFTIAGLVQGQLPNACSYIPPREGENWVFFLNNNLVSFRGGAPMASSLTGGMIQGKKGTASISDKSGNLLFYTDGMQVWNKNNQIMLYGDKLFGNKACTQSSLIVPLPGADHLFYLFTVDFLTPQVAGGTRGINYTRIDLTGDNGSGEVTLLNKRLIDKSPEKITGVKHANGIDIWVLVHEYDSDAFRAYLVKSSGLDTIPVISHIGAVQTGNNQTNNAIGHMKLSADGRKLALADFGTKLIEIFDFNSSTGVVSNARTIPSPEGRNPYGIEFSPNGNYLYFTTVEQTLGQDNNLYQLDLTIPGSTPLLLNQITHDVSALQLAVDGKIYVGRFNKNMLGSIENPNRPDVACNYNEDALPLVSKSYLGLPNFIQSYFNIPAVTFDTKCFNDQTLFKITNPSNTDSWAWDFGDPSGVNNTLNIQSPAHQYSAPGNYTVTLTETFNGRNFVSTIPVTIHPLPRKSFMRDTIPIDSLYIFPGSIIQLDAGAYMTTYLWKNGYSGRIFPVSEPGIYNVFIVDTNCCQMSDTIKIILLDLGVPSAFTPNGDQLNDLFRVKGPTEGIDNYHFSVFNQWGQMLWDTNDFLKGWDGKMNGTFCSTGLYTWLMQFSVKGNIMSDGNVVKRGVFVLLR
jgi:gliding motility-associated-like protein